MSSNSLDYMSSSVDSMGSQFTGSESSESENDLFSRPYTDALRRTVQSDSDDSDDGLMRAPDYVETRPMREEHTRDNDLEDSEKDKYFFGLPDPESPRGVADNLSPIPVLPAISKYRFKPVFRPNPKLRYSGITSFSPYSPYSLPVVYASSSFKFHYKEVINKSEPNTLIIGGPKEPSPIALQFNQDEQNPNADLVVADEAVSAYDSDSDSEEVKISEEEFQFALEL